MFLTQIIKSEFDWLHTFDNVHVAHVVKHWTNIKIKTINHSNTDRDITLGSDFLYLSRLMKPTMTKDVDFDHF